jgi:uncharacterized membrane protein
LRGQRFLAWLIALTLIVADMALVGQHALARYQTYHAYAFDLGNMDQAVWNTLHGHPFRFTNRGIDWFGPPTRLGVHVEPILFLIAPLYLLHAGPETLILLQTIALALGGIPLLLLGLRRLPEVPLVATAFVGAYLTTPEILGEALWEFHGVTLATPLLLLALWALDGRRYRWFAVGAILAALCKEDVALSLVPLGLLIAFRQGKPGQARGLPLLGGAVSLLAAAWVALCFLLILPHFNQDTVSGNNFWYRYTWLGSSPGIALRNVLTQPLLLFSVLQDPAKRSYLVVLLRTGGGLGVFAPMLWLCALPELAINILSTQKEQYSAFFQYNAVLLPYLMTAAISGTAAFYHGRRRVEESVCTAALSRREARGPRLPAQLSRVHLAIRGQHEGCQGKREAARASARLAPTEAVLRRLPIRSQWIVPLVMVWLMVSTYWNIAATSALVQPFWMAGSHPNAQQAQIDALLAKVPPSASVAATDTLNPHLSDRYTVYLLPDPQSYTADYVAFDLPDAVATSQQADQRMYDVMLASGSYTVIGTAGNVVLLQRSNLLLLSEK